MMITTDFAPGSPCWLDFGTPDVAATTTFYGSVFGWQLRSFGPEAGGYGFFQLDGRTVGAVGPLEEEGAGSAWTIYGHAWERARKAALTPAEFNSPLAKRPYDLRHAAVSTWLSAGVPPTQVAEWAGHSVTVLLQIYAKTLAGREDLARWRVQQVLDEG